MATQVTLNSGSVDSAGTLALRTNGTTSAVSISTAQVVTITNDASISGLTVGKGGGSVSTNTAVGASALNANTTGSLSVAIGTSALAANTTSDANTAVGYQAASTQTTGALYTTAVGYQSLKANTSGSQNNALGFQSLTANTTGSNNNGFGAYALAGNTTGASNTAVGESALRSNTTASNNTAVGYQAGYTNSTGTRFTALGFQAGYTSNANQSTYVGAYAGYNATGAKNTFIGDGVGYAVTTGTNNTFIGVDGGTNGAAGGAVTTGSKNTIIGGYSGNQGGLDIRTSSNYIVLSDGDGNPAIYNRPAGASAASGKNTTVFGMVDAPASGETVTVNCNNNSAASFSYGIIVSGRPSDVTVNAMRFYNANASTIVGSIQINPTTTTYATSSDYRLKENIAPMTGALATIAQLKPVTYKWKQDGSDGQGFIAHELQEVMPDAVVGKKDAVDEDGKPVYQGIDTSFLVATLTAAIQELKTIVDAQAAEIAELKAKVA